MNVKIGNEWESWTLEEFTTYVTLEQLYVEEIRPVDQIQPFHSTHQINLHQFYNFENVDLKITEYDYEGKKQDPPTLNSVWSDPEVETLSEEVLDLAFAYVYGKLIPVYLTKDTGLNLQYKDSNGKY